MSNSFHLKGYSLTPSNWAIPIRYFFILALLASFAVPGVAYAAPTPSMPMYVSFDGAGSVPGVDNFADDDILKFDGTTWSMFFNGADVGLGSGQDITAIAFLDEDRMLMVFDEPGTVGTAPNTVDYTASDILVFTATQWGTQTAGTFSMFLDGSEVGLEDAVAERIDSLAILPDGSLLISTTGNPNVVGVSALDEDILRFVPNNPANYSAGGTWSLYFDGSDVGLGLSNDQDITNLDLAGENIFHIGTLGASTLGSVSGDELDIFTCTASATGDTTTCPWDSALYFDGSAHVTAHTSDGHVALDAFTLPRQTGMTLTVTGITAQNKVYNGTTDATINTGSATLVGVQMGHNGTLVTNSAQGHFLDKHVGNNKTVQISGLSLAGADANKYTLIQPTTTANITKRPLTADATGVNKVYDGTTTATVTFTSNKVDGDTIGFNYTANFADKDAGNNKFIQVSNISLTGPDAGNYSLTSPTDTTSANITQAPLTVTATNQTKVIGEPDPAFTFTYSGFVNGENSSVIDTPPTCTVSVAHTLPGTYPIVCSGGSDDNYSFTYVNGTLTVSESNVPTFQDVPNDYWAWSFIERLYKAGITGGCQTSPDVLYCPGSVVTRDQMAVFLLRGIYGASYNPPAVGASTGFADVPTDHWAAAWIKQLAAEGITGGCGNGNYCPGDVVTRDQMAVFLLKAKHGKSYAPPAVGTSTGFTDVPTDHWAAAWIKQLVAEAITGGCAADAYCPGNPVTRDQMAVFLVKTFNLP